MHDQAPAAAPVPTASPAAEPAAAVRLLFSSLLVRSYRHLGDAEKRTYPYRQGAAAELAFVSDDDMGPLFAAVQTARADRIDRPLRECREEFLRSNPAYLTLTRTRRRISETRQARISLWAAALGAGAAHLASEYAERADWREGLRVRELGQAIAADVGEADVRQRWRRLDQEHAELSERLAVLEALLPRHEQAARSALEETLKACRGGLHADLQRERDAAAAELATVVGPLLPALHSLDVLAFVVAPGRQWGANRSVLDGLTDLPAAD